MAEKLEGDKAVLEEQLGEARRAHAELCKVGLGGRGRSACVWCGEWAVLVLVLVAAGRRGARAPSKVHRGGGGAGCRTSAYIHVRGYCCGAVGALEPCAAAAGGRGWLCPPMCAPLLRVQAGKQLAAAESTIRESTIQSMNNRAETPDVEVGRRPSPCLLCHFLQKRRSPACHS